MPAPEAAVPVVPELREPVAAGGGGAAGARGGGLVAITSELACARARVHAIATISHTFAHAAHGVPRLVRHVSQQ